LPDNGSARNVLLSMIRAIIIRQIDILSLPGLTVFNLTRDYARRWPKVKLNSSESGRKDKARLELGDSQLFRSDAVSDEPRQASDLDGAHAPHSELKMKHMDIAIRDSPIRSR